MGLRHDEKRPIEIQESLPKDPALNSVDTHL
jgi:hypothetical protein